MYPRNASSPERIAIGPVVQISDGAVQTSGVTVRVLPFGSTEADGGGTTAYSTDGVVIYTPTQAETNYTSFVLIAKKTGCIPATVTVVTSASATAGYAGTDQSKITNATATVNLSGTTIKSVTDAVALPASASINITGNITGNVSGSVGSVTGNVGGNVVGSVASVTNSVTANVTQIGGQTASAAAPVSFPASVANETTVASRASQTSVNSIPTNPLLTNDARLNNLDATISSRATQASVSLIPTNPLLTNDTRLNYLDASIATSTNSVLSAITGLNNLSAKCNLFGASLLEAPDTGSTVYEFTLVVKDDEDKLVNLDASPTVTATNAAGTNRSANLSSVTNPSVGRYRFTYTVSSSHSRENLRIEASGTISTEARYAIWSGAVVDYDQSTVLAQISAGVAAIPTNPVLVTDARLNNLDATVSSRATQTSVNNIPVNPLLTNDSRLNYLNASILAIPTNPLLTTDTRLNNLDATVSSRATQTSVNNLPSATTITNQVYSALPTAGWPNGSFGDRFLVSDTNQRTVAVTGSHHIAADVHENQPGSFHFDTLDATVLPGILNTNHSSYNTANTIGKTLNDTNTSLATLLSRVNASAAQLFVDLSAMLTGTGTALVKWTANALSLGPTGEQSTIVATVAVPQLLEQTAFELQAIVVYRGCYWSFQVQDLGDLSTYPEIFFSLRRRQDDDEEDSELLVSKTQGLVIANKQSVGIDSTKASLTVSGQNVTIQVHQDITKFIAPTNNYNYDLKGITVGGQAIMLHESDKFTVKRDVTRRTN